MPNRNSVDRLLQICRTHVAETRRSIELMQAGHMTISKMRHGRMMDATKEAINEKLMSILDLESTIANIEHERAGGLR